jgi:hypothetical protein
LCWLNFENQSEETVDNAEEMLFSKEGWLKIVIRNGKKPLIVKGISSSAGGHMGI